MPIMSAALSRRECQFRIFWFRFEEVFMKFRPLHDRVLIRRVESEEKTAGGIIIPDTAKEKPMEGEVVGAGPGAGGDGGKVNPVGVNAGAAVVFGNGAAT